MPDNSTEKLKIPFFFFLLLPGILVICTVDRELSALLWTGKGGLNRCFRKQVHLQRYSVTQVPDHK